jgi:hypothetical protein
MCIVHRILTDTNTGLKAAVRFEFPPKKGITLSTREITNGMFSLGVTSLEAGTTTAITLAKKRTEQVRHEPFTDRLRRQENARLAGRLPLIGIEEHHLSHQCGGNLLADSPDRHHDGSCGPRHGLGASRRNCGRKPRDKHHRRHATVW